MPRRLICAAMGLAAVLAIVAGLAWKTFHPPESYWSQQQAREYQDAFRAVHSLQDADEHEATETHAAEFAAAQDRFQKLRADLENAQAARDRTGRNLTIFGLLLLLSAVALRHYWFTARDAEDPLEVP